MKPTRRLLALAVFSLAACHRSEQPPAQVVTQSQSGIEVSDARIQLPILPGRPGAAYFVVSNKGSKPVSLKSVSIDGAKSAQIHQTTGGSMSSVDQIAMAPGASVKLEPGGLHVMVFDVDPAWREGGSTNMTLTFADGDTVTAPLKITKFHGDPNLDYGGHEMSGMDKGAMH